MKGEELIKVIKRICNLTGFSLLAIEIKSKVDNKTYTK